MEKSQHSLATHHPGVQRFEFPLEKLPKKPVCHLIGYSGGPPRRGFSIAHGSGAASGYRMRLATWSHKSTPCVTHLETPQRVFGTKWCQVCSTQLWRRHRWLALVVVGGGHFGGGECRRLHSNLGTGGHCCDPNEGHKIGVVVTCTINHTLEPNQMVQISRESFEAFSAGAASPDCLSCQRLGPLKICANQHFSYPKTHGSRIWISFFEM